MSIEFSIVCSLKLNTSVIYVLIFVWHPSLEAVCMFIGLCIVSAFSLLLGVLFYFYCFSCCISFLSCSICSSFELNVWLVLELLLDGILPCRCCNFLGVCVSNFSRYVCSSFAALVFLVLYEIMQLLYFALPAPDMAFKYNFLNAVGSLVGCNVSSLVVLGLYLRL